MANEKNVLGKPLQLCCGNGGFTREGFCYVPKSDIGNHSVCVVVSEEFLAFSRAVGNDLSTPIPEYQFAGLKPGDRWCLCASRWEEARQHNKAPRVILEATNVACLSEVKLEDLKEHQYQR
ncbi:DUF2237 family protein [Alteromonadaceae bacterium M269]|nr:DUF2237 family protein [Alteromonadaceae bacterium M269]